MSKLIEQIKNCPGCAKRRAKIKRAFHILIPTKLRVHTTHRRIITMPLHMNPGWLPSIERDKWVAHRDRALYTMGFKGKHGLRRYQRGSVSAFVQAAAAQQGAGGDCTFTASNVPGISDFAVEPSDSRVRCKLDNNGDWYWSEGSTSYGSSRGTWIGDCANTEYDGQWNQISGDAVNEVLSPATGATWQAMSTDLTVGLLENGFGSLNNSMNFKIRDGNSLNELFTDSFLMDVEVDARN